MSKLLNALKLAEAKRHSLMQTTLPTIDTASLVMIKPVTDDIVPTLDAHNVEPNSTIQTLVRTEKFSASKEAAHAQRRTLLQTPISTRALADNLQDIGHDLDTNDAPIEAMMLYRSQKADRNANDLFQTEDFSKKANSEKCSQHSRLYFTHLRYLIIAVSCFGLGYLMHMIYGGSGQDNALSNKNMSSQDIQQFAQDSAQETDMQLKLDKNLSRLPISPPNKNSQKLNSQH